MLQSGSPIFRVPTYSRVDTRQPFSPRHLDHLGYHPPPPVHSSSHTRPRAFSIPTMAVQPFSRSRFRQQKIRFQRFVPSTGKDAFTEQGPYIGVGIGVANSSKGVTDRPTWFVGFGETGVLYSPRILTGIPCKLRAVRVNESLATLGVVYLRRSRRQNMRHLGMTISSPQSDHPSVLLPSCPFHLLMLPLCNLS